MGRLRRRQWSLAFVGCLGPIVSYAHSFGTPYILPVPMWMYVYGCGATLIVTFALLGCFAGLPTRYSNAPTRKLIPGKAGRLVGRWGLWLLQAGAAGCLLLTIVAGLIGSSDPAHNIGMTLFWVFFLLGFTYLTLFVGDLYALINPWKAAVDGLERLGWDLSIARVDYPAYLGCWPAFVFYVMLIWVELFLEPKPFVLSSILMAYGAITVAGCALFGKVTWFCQADFFSIFFRLIGKLAPVEYRQARDPISVEIWLRAPFVGVLNDSPKSFGILLFILFMLSSTTYDSIHDTVLWKGLYWRNMLWLSQPLWGTDLGKAQSVLMGGYLFYRQIGLLLFPFLYLTLYLVALQWAKISARTRVPLHTLALDFCYSLIPIAVAYNFTHYYTFLITQSSIFPWYISDPFGFGWDLLGIGPLVETSTLQMGVVWHTEVAVLLVGHVVSVYLAHKMATRTFRTQQQVIISQLPLLMLMVVYTIVGLWILSLPLASGNE